MLGMYVHTHWGYDRPYCARAWILADWEDYLEGLVSLGFDSVLFWPLLDCMPPRPNRSDRAFLANDDSAWPALAVPAARRPVSGEPRDDALTRPRRDRSRQSPERTRRCCTNPREGRSASSTEEPRTADRPHALRCSGAFSGEWTTRIPYIWQKASTSRRWLP